MKRWRCVQAQNQACGLAQLRARDHTSLVGETDEALVEGGERKEAYLNHLLTADEDVLRVSLADKVHNARAILRDLRKPEIGEKIWSRFSQRREKTLWYYRGLADRFRGRLPGQLSNELHEIVEVLEAEG
jgi:hypothetical protein